MTVFTSTATLTKIIVNPSHPNVRRDLRDVQRMHHVVTALACRPDFGPSSRSAAGLLYRVEHTTSTGVRILVQSTTQPDPNRLTPGYDIAGSTDLGPLLDHLHTGLRVRYRIIANPTKSRSHGSGQRGTLRPLVGQEALDWWKRKSDGSGLQLTSVDSTTKARFTGNRGHARLVITTTTFEGTAVVTNPAAVREAILTGVGRGRAYGCGLLSLAPLP